MTRHTAYFGSVWNVPGSTRHETAEPPPPQGAVHVVEHLVGYSELLLSNGDRVRIHLHVDAFTHDPVANTYVPVYRVIPEVISREGAFEPRFGLTKRELM